MLRRHISNTATFFKKENMDQLFKKLPRDLQWKILVEFLGTHVVRNGKLMRKIVFTIRDGVTVRHIGRDDYLPVVNPTRIRETLSWLYKSRHGDPDYGDPRPFYIPFYIPFFSGENFDPYAYTEKRGQMKFYADARTGETLYGYRKVIGCQLLWVIYSPRVDLPL